MSTRSFWPPCEAAQLDYEALRAHLLAHDKLPDGLAALDLTAAVWLG